MKKIKLVSIIVFMVLLGVTAFAENVDELKKKNKEIVDSNRISKSNEDKSNKHNYTVRKRVEPDTLFNMNDIYFSGYGAPVVKYTRLAGGNNLLVGGKGGFIINDSLVIGGGGYGSTIPIEKIIDGDKKDIHLGFGGFLLEYLFFPKSIINFSVGTLIGAGGTGYEKDSDSFRGDSFFFVSPEINLFVNVTKFFKIGIGADYRYVYGVDSYGLSDSDLSGFSASLIFAFGLF